MTPNEQKAREWMGSTAGASCACKACEARVSQLASLLDEVAEQARREAQAKLDRYEARIWRHNTGTVDSCSFCGIWRDDPEHRTWCPASYK